MFLTLLQINQCTRITFLCWIVGGKSLKVILKERTIQTQYSCMELKGLNPKILQDFLFKNQLRWHHKGLYICSECEVWSSGFVSQIHLFSLLQWSITNLAFQLLSILDKETGEHVQTVQMRLRYNRYVSTKKSLSFSALLFFSPTWAWLQTACLITCATFHNIKTQQKKKTQTLASQKNRSHFWCSSTQKQYIQHRHIHTHTHK